MKWSPDTMAAQAHSPCQHSMFWACSQPQPGTFLFLSEPTAVQKDDLLSTWLACVACTQISPAGACCNKIKACTVLSVCLSVCPAGGEAAWSCSGAHICGSVWRQRCGKPDQRAQEGNRGELSGSSSSVCNQPLLQNPLLAAQSVK